MNRKIKLISPRAYELLKEFKELSIKVADFQSQIEKLEEERNKLAMKGQKVKDKLSPIMENLTKGEVGDFEVVVNVSRTNKEGEVEVDIVNALEQFKDAYRKKKLEPEKK